MSTVSPRPKTRIAIFLLATLLGSHLFVFLPVRNAYAVIIPVHVTSTDPIKTWVITNPPFASLTSTDTLKQYVLDLAARIVAGTLLRALTNQVIGWIQGDGGANVGFVGNLDATFRNEVNLAGGEFLNNLAGIDLCTVNMRAFLNISLRTPALAQRLGCTLTGIQGNLDDFFRDFENGGWRTFINVGLTPQNNPYGAYLIALDSKIALEDAARRRIELGYAQGQGFLGGRGAIRKCEALSTSKAFTAPVPEGKERTPLKIEIPRGQASMVCFTEYDTKTPGGYVANALNKTFDVGYDFAVVADEINEAIAAIVNAVIFKVVSSTYSALNPQTGETETGPGIFEPELSKLPFGAQELAGHSLYQRVSQTIFTADAALTTLDAVLVQTQRDLFATRRQIEALLGQTDIENPERQAQLAALRKTESELETKFNGDLTKKQAVMRSRGELAAIARAFVGAVGAEEIVAASQQLEPALSRLSEATREIEGIGLPASATGDLEQDIATLLHNTETQLSNGVTLLTDLKSEINRLLTATSTTLAPQQKSQLTARSDAVGTEITRLRDSQAAITAIRGRLERAATAAEITAAQLDAVSEMSAANSELQKANTLIIQIQPELKL